MAGKNPHASRDRARPQKRKLKPREKPRYLTIRIPISPELVSAIIALVDLLRELLPLARVAKIPRKEVVKIPQQEQKTADLFDVVGARRPQ